jgi:hypothetical protein
MIDLLDQGSAPIPAAMRAGKTSASDVAEIVRVEARNMRQAETALT